MYMICQYTHIQRGRWPVKMQDCKLGIYYLNSRGNENNSHNQTCPFTHISIAIFNQWIIQRSESIIQQMSESSGQDYSRAEMFSNEEN